MVKLRIQTKQITNLCVNIEEQFINYSFNDLHLSNP